ncbi:unnamed protein product [Onchocerca flexuosa]|uniref:Pre-mRNA-splicing factor 38 n=1 Tax=Onchocerca flexuosa TaxID=387005 RepID=A0A183HHR1_9BILA|nr:unnamed protein product [Onchocerca flexuosa]
MNNEHLRQRGNPRHDRILEVRKGLYYSFYKKLIGEPSFLEGLNQITNDNVTEYGHTINTLKRFNLYPEVILGIAFKLFRKVTDRSHWVVERCWQVNRGDVLPPVVSCEGTFENWSFIFSIIILLLNTNYLEYLLKI